MVMFDPHNWGYKPSIIHQADVYGVINQPKLSFRLKGTCAGRPTSIRILDMIHLMDFRGCIVIWASQLARRRQGDPNGDKNRLKADAF